MFLYFATSAYRQPQRRYPLVISQVYCKVYHWQSEHERGTFVTEFTNIVTACTDRWSGRAGLWPAPKSVRFKSSTSLRVGTRVYLCWQRSGTPSHWMPDRLFATAWASLNGFAGPWCVLSRDVLTLTEDILVTCYKCLLSVITHKYVLFPSHVLM
jgi:hypothetical protein